ncbi:hypothetical protein CBS101457_004137 [Exobasidium rhododendri]|nr:hypothetical protein CBS101457_004137 [Exobasidium rhododendri]
MSFSSATSNIRSDGPPELDHIVHLVKLGKLQDCISLYEKLGFSVERGGIHADGLTQNALLILNDGVYVEFIEFLEKPPKRESNSALPEETVQQWKARREQHWWWGKKEGWIDWCLKGGIADRRIASINRARGLVIEKERAAQTNSQLNTMVQYQDSLPGGRKALNGKEIKWNVTFPVGPRQVRGTYPFWCEDVTPRDWRVPTPYPTHHNLSQGLTALTLLYYPETYPSRLASLQLLLSSPSRSAEEMQGGLIDLDPPPIVEGQVALPNETVVFYLSTPVGRPLSLHIKAAEDPFELHWLEQRGEGLFEVEVSVASGKLPPTAPPDGVERLSSDLGYGRLRLHPIRGLTKATST